MIRRLALRSSGMSRTALGACTLTITIVATSALGVACAPRAIMPGGEAQLAADLKVSSAKFGVLQGASSRKPRFAETSQVGMDGQSLYGWVALVESRRPSVKVREELTLPSVPKKWNVGVMTTISKDQRTAVTESLLPVLKGHVQNFWGIQPGDPAGEYRLRVFLEETLAGEFRFQVSGAADGKSRLPAAQ